MHHPTLNFPDRDPVTPEIPPTWTANSTVFHTTERCARLRSIPPAKRITGKPYASLRHCFNCEDIARTKRRG